MQVSFNFIGTIDLTASSIVLAVLVALSQFVVARMMMPLASDSQPEEKSLQNDLAKSMQVQMRYVFPIVMGVVAYVISAAIALYFLVSNLFAIGQELYVRRVRNEKDA